jgi:REP element-mobilizing transposase RayT
MNDLPTAYLFVHVIWCVKKREPLLTRPVRKILFAQIQKDSEERGMKVLAVNGVEDHVHCLLQLLPSQNLAQVIKSIRTLSSGWLNGNKFLAAPFEWEEGYAAYSVSPSSLKQVMDFIGKQEDHHKSKTLESELEVFEKLKESL